MNERQIVNKILHDHLEVNKNEDYTNYKKLITALIDWKELAINFTDSSLQLNDKKTPITFGRYCASRGYHKFEGNWVNKQKFPRDIDWITKMYNKDVFDL